ncbi:MAG: helicase-associated domain-containing protein [Planctomycetes bacterium]|nr:helicase-associated domain-containing protein [Planctomycetota bacterium]MBL7008790.1 helicase-associated domain-containing protein [Planctomycetota bacterium]
MSLSLSRNLAQRSESELMELHHAWLGGAPPATRPALVKALRDRMRDPAAASAQRAKLPDGAAAVLDLLLGAPKVGMDFESMLAEASRHGLKAGGLRSALAELVSSGLCGTRSSMAKRNRGETLWTVSEDLREALAALATGPVDVVGLLTLHGHLARHFRRQEPVEAADNTRRMYRFLASESALCGRIDGLPEDVRLLVHRVISEYGGVISLDELDSLGFRAADAARLRHELEQASVGTLGDLDLERCGIRQRGPVLAVFNEAVLAYLRREAQASGGPPADSASIGVDFVSNFSRFASFVGDETVRFTVRGTIFKSTGKRIADSLIPNPGKEFRRRDILELEYRFALAYRFIDRTGERSFRLTQPGQDFLRMPLADKQRLMLDWLVEDRDQPGDMAHQLRLRRTALRFLKRLEPGVWYDAMFLPFVARNHYLGTLAAEIDGNAEAKSFPVRSSADLRSLAWNLFTWIRKHLYLLGIVDMGYDATGRASAIRLTAMGAELLGIIPGRDLEGTGHVVVNPDFEVVLFPDVRSHELVYALDRFCDRELSDSLVHYRITPGSLHRGLQQGAQLDEILELLRERSRTPLPQNVVYSLESWARSDGLVTLHEDGRLVCDTPEILDRLQLHPELGRIGLERLGRDTLRLRGPVDRTDLSAWVRDFGVSLRIAS